MIQNVQGTICSISDIFETSNRFYKQRRLFVTIRLDDSPEFLFCEVKNEIIDEILRCEIGAKIKFDLQLESKKNGNSWYTTIRIERLSK